MPTCANLTNRHTWHDESKRDLIHIIIHGASKHTSVIGKIYQPLTQNHPTWHVAWCTETYWLDWNTWMSTSTWQQLSHSQQTW